MTGLELLKQEIDLNLERVYVMEQRQFVSMKLERTAEVPSYLEEYGVAVDAFNKAFDDHAAFQSAYSSCIENKTRPNALILDEKHDDVDQKFLQLKPLILEAKELLRSMLER